MTRGVVETAIVAGFCWMLALPATAGELRLEIRDGFVTLDAREVTVRQILAEWARVGQTRIINGEKVAGGPVTLQLTRVPERYALDVVLRSVGGYLAAPRPTFVAAASVYDRVLVLPVSVVTASAGVSRPASQTLPAPFPATGEAAATRRPPTGERNVDEDENDEDTARPDASRAAPLPFALVPPGAQDVAGQPAAVQFPAGATPQGVTPRVTGPWGAPAGSAPVPGVVVQPPQQPAPGQRPPRPPGPPGER